MQRWPLGPHQWDVSRQSHPPGWIAFGLKPLQTPLGATLENSVAIKRLVIISIYVSISLLFTAGLAFFISVTTNVPLGAVGGAIGVVILLNILDAISGLGNIRIWLPVHYSFSWFDALSSTVQWGSMIRGASYSIMTFSLFIAWSIIKFGKKDVTS